MRQPIRPFLDFLISVLVLSIVFFEITPRRRWASKILDDWAFEHDYVILHREEPDAIDRSLHRYPQILYLIDVRSSDGRDYKGQAVIGHWLLGPIVKRIRVEWIKS